MSWSEVAPGILGFLRAFLHYRSDVLELLRLRLRRDKWPGFFIQPLTSNP